MKPYRLDALPILLGALCRAPPNELGPAMPEPTVNRTNSPIIVEIVCMSKMANRKSKAEAVIVIQEPRRAPCRGLIWDDRRLAINDPRVTPPVMAM